MSATKRKKSGRVRRPLGMKDVFEWVDGSLSNRLPQKCQFCKKNALVLLPQHVLKKQPDRTNAVCHPDLGGCNHGFNISGFPVNTKRKKGCSTCHGNKEVAYLSLPVGRRIHKCPECSGGSVPKSVQRLMRKAAA